MAATNLIDGAMYWRLCQIGPDHWDNQGGFVYRRSQPRPPEVVAIEALAAIAVPPPVPATSPARELPQVVGLPTWLWIDRTTWTPLHASVDAGGFTVTATVTPTTVHWDMGEDPHSAPTICDGPGTPYDPARPPEGQHSDCTYTYRWASDTLTDTHDTPDTRYHATVTTTWAVTWHTSDGQNGALADITRTTPFSLRVTEIQAAICHTHPTPCHHD